MRKAGGLRGEQIDRYPITDETRFFHRTSWLDVVELINNELKSAIKPKYTENPIKNYVKDTLADATKCMECHSGA